MVMRTPSSTEPMRTMSDDTVKPTGMSKKVWKNVNSPPLRQVHDRPHRADESAKAMSVRATAVHAASPSGGIDASAYSPGSPCTEKVRPKHTGPEARLICQGLPEAVRQGRQLVFTSPTQALQLEVPPEATQVWVPPRQTPTPSVPGAPV
jgi:hypothetical protein